MAVKHPIGSETMGDGNQASLTAVKTRIEWARKYVAELKSATNAFMDDGKDGTAIDYKQDNRVGRIHISVHLPSGFPEDFGRIIGGAFHELRAAFDNLAYQLVLANGGAPTRSTAFPIFLNANGNFAARTKKQLKGISSSARAQIERLQPYNERPKNPENSTLWLIHELNNIDKHRIAHLACLWIATCNGTLYGKGATAQAVEGRIEKVHRRGIAEDGDTLLDFRWNPALRNLLANPELMMELDISSDVGLRNPERVSFLDPDELPTEALPIAHFLDAALKYCEATVLPAFVGEFK